MIDFDSIDVWGPLLTDALSACVPASVSMRIKAAQPEYVEDARDLLFDSGSRDAVIDAVLAWTRSISLFGYHGTRLTDDEVVSVRSRGLIPLRAEDRRARLERALSQHARWPEVNRGLDAAIMAHGRGKHAGGREGEVHLTLSKYALTNGFNHYLTHGAEFDQHVAHALLGQEGVDLLASDAKARLVRVAVPGNTALDAAHRRFTIDELRARGDLPNIVREFLQSWAFRLSRADFQCRTLKVDCGMVFRAPIPPEWIVGIATLEAQK
jgi:hypothetical protein